MKWFEKCEYCGKFLSFRNPESLVTYTHYGRSGDIEPPDASFLHLSCWNKFDVKQKRLFFSVTWIKPCNVLTNKRMEIE